MTFFYRNLNKKTIFVSEANKNSSNCSVQHWHVNQFNSGMLTELEISIKEEGEIPVQIKTISGPALEYFFENLKPVRKTDSNEIEYFLGRWR